MPIRKKPKKEKVKKPGKLRAAALAATRAANRANTPSDFLGLTGAAYTPGAWTSATEGNPNSTWNGSTWSNVPTGSITRPSYWESVYGAAGSWANQPTGQPINQTVRPGAAGAPQFQSAINNILSGLLGNTSASPSARPKKKPKPKNPKNYYNASNYGTPSAPRPGTSSFPEFQPASTILGQLYDIARGVDPYTGDIQPAYGTTGTLKFSPLGYDLTYEMMGTGALHYPANRFGAESAMELLSRGIDPATSNNWKLPSGLTGKSPKRFNPRPRWLQWYESIQ